MDTQTVEPEPLTPAVFYILLSLADGPQHGYAIMQSVAHDTDNRIRLGPGTLYGTIKRLLTARWVEESPEADNTPAQPGAERRRYYRLTDAGRRALKAESQRLQRAVELARNRRLLPEGL